MAWPITRSYKDAGSTTRTVIVDATATSGEDVPIEKLAFGASGADPTVVTAYAGLPVQAAKLSGGPTTYARIVPSIAAATGTGNGNTVAVGGTGGSAVPGLFRVQADVNNTGVIYLGDTNANAFTGHTRGLGLEPGSSELIGTDDLRAWKASFSNVTDALTVLKVGS